MVISASRASYSPESRVRTSSASTAFLILAQLALGLGERVGVALLLAELDHDLEVLDAARAAR